MRLIGFNFNKISIEKKAEELSSDLKIKSNLDVLSIEKIDIGLSKEKEESLLVKFSYIINYDPNIAVIDLNGLIIISLDSKIAKDLLQKWKKKTIPEEIRVSLFNIILRKVNVKALELEDEMNLPLHVPLPRIKGENTPQDKA
ncbi:MAG: hypothetical protein KKA64_02525 [Nanoarchaeota archaeon]|nr:hypothetical protein [Nanoarchaeota archaeon]